MRLSKNVEFFSTKDRPTPQQKYYIYIYINKYKVQKKVLKLFLLLWIGIGCFFLAAVLAISHSAPASLTRSPSLRPWLLASWPWKATLKGSRKLVFQSHPFSGVNFLLVSGRVSYLAVGVWLNHQKTLEEQLSIHNFEQAPGPMCNPYKHSFWEGKPPLYQSACLRDKKYSTVEECCLEEFEEYLTAITVLRPMTVAATTTTTQVACRRTFLFPCSTKPALAQTSHIRRGNVHLVSLAYFFSGWKRKSFPGIIIPWYVSLPESIKITWN